MKTKKKISLASMAFLLLISLSSCATTGEYMPLSGNDVVIGTVQVTFKVQSSFFSMKKVRDAVNTEAYIKLLEAAEKKYSGNSDIRDIVWVTGKQDKKDPSTTEIFAAGKVIRVGFYVPARFPADKETLSYSI